MGGVRGRARGRPCRSGDRQPADRRPRARPAVRGDPPARVRPRPDRVPVTSLRADSGTGMSAVLDRNEERVRRCGAGAPRRLELDSDVVGARVRRGADSPRLCSRCRAGWPTSPASSTSRLPRSASRTRSGSLGSRRSGRALSSGSGPSPRRSCARRPAGRYCPRSWSPCVVTGACGVAHRARDGAAARSVRRRQHVDPELDRPAHAHVVPRDLGRSAGARDARGEPARPHADADGALRARRRAAGGRGPRLRRAVAPRARARSRRRTGSGRSALWAWESPLHASVSERSRPRR